MPAEAEASPPPPQPARRTEQVPEVEDPQATVLSKPVPPTVEEANVPPEPAQATDLSEPAVPALAEEAKMPAEAEASPPPPQPAWPTEQAPKVEDPQAIDPSELAEEAGNLAEDPPPPPQPAWHAEVPEEEDSQATDRAQDTDLSKPVLPTREEANEPPEPAQAMSVTRAWLGGNQLDDSQGSRMDGPVHPIVLAMAGQWNSSDSSDSEQPIVSKFPDRVISLRRAPDTATASSASSASSARPQATGKQPQASGGRITDARSWSGSTWTREEVMPGMTIATPDSPSAMLAVPVAWSSEGILGQRAETPASGGILYIRRAPESLRNPAGSREQDISEASAGPLLPGFDTQWDDEEMFDRDTEEMVQQDAQEWEARRAQAQEDKAIAE